jgi:4-hydroxybenzoate polyprenyltransferase
LNFFGRESAFQNAQRHLTLSPKAIVDASPLSLQPYLKLIRFDRPIGTWLLFLPCAWSISLAAPAGHLPDPCMLALFALGSFSMRAAACTINDMWDKDYDARVERTKDRPLACGQISQFRALTFLALPLSASLGILLTFNWNTVALGACSMFPCIIYPLMKRITYWPQAFLGITLNWGVMIAWSAIHGSLDLTGLTLYTSCVLWTMIYDTIYSHQDKADDIQVGVKSTALKFGNHTKHWLAGFTTGVAGGLVTAGVMCNQPWTYYAGVCVVAAHLANQIHSVDLNDADSCARTFRSNRNLGLIFWAFIVGSGLLMASDSDKKMVHSDTNNVLAGGDQQVIAVGDVETEDNS